MLKMIVRSIDNRELETVNLEGRLFVKLHIEGKLFVKNRGRKKEYYRSSPTTHFMLISDYITYRASFTSVLEKYNGYLYAGDRVALHKFLYEDVHPGKVDLPYLISRAENFKLARIPPIFIEDFESISKDGSVFPILDEIILHGSGNREKRIAGSIWMKTKITGKNEVEYVRIPRCHPEDVILYAERAYDSGDINLQFIRDLEFKIRNRDTASDERILEYENNRQ